MKTFFKSLFTITFFAFLTKLLSFLLKVFLSREIGAEAIGMIQVASSICMVFMTLSSSGLNIIVSKKTSEYYNSDKKQKVFSMVTACLILDILISSISILLVLCCSSIIKKLTSESIYILLLCMLPCLLSSSISCSLTGYFWGRKNHFANSFSEFFEQFLRNIFCLILVSTAPNPVNGAIRVVLSMSVACVISTILTLLLYIKVDGKFKKPSKSDFSDLIKSSFPITFVKFINSFTHPVIAIIVPIQLGAMGFTQSQALSMFGIMQGMTLPLIMLPMMLISALNTVLIPDLVSFYTKKRYIESQNIINMTICFSLFITCLILPIYTSIGKNIGIFLFDNSSCGIYLSKSAWIMIPCAISGITSAILNVLNLEKKSSRNFIISTFVMLICSIILPYFLDILSIPFSMGISMIINSLLNCISIRKNLHFNPKIIPILTKFLLVGIPTHFFTINIYGIMNKYFTMFYSLFIGALIGVIFYVVLCLIFKIINIKVIFAFKNQANQLFYNSQN